MRRGSPTSVGFFHSTTARTTRAFSLELAMTKITGDAVALVSKYTRFDPANPEKTAADEFSIVSKDSLTKEGALLDEWAKDGYIMVGTARIEIELLPAKEMTAKAVSTLRKQKEQVLATAQAEATRIEGQIQSLLAIEHVSAA